MAAPPRIPPRRAPAPRSAAVTAHRRTLRTYRTLTMTHFTEPEMQKLAEVYKDFDCLWNIRHKFYKSREVRQAAYEQMLQRLNIPGLTVQDIPKKIKNFRSSYYQEIKRIRNSINAGDSAETVYKPKVSWFACADEYLSSIWTEKHLKYYRPRPEYDYIINGSELQIKKFRTNSDGITKELHIPTTLMPTSPPEKQAAANKPVSKKVEVTQNTTRKGIDDEFDSFGKYVAAALRGMPQEFSITAKTELQNTLSDIQLRIVRQNSPSRSSDPLSEPPVSPCSISRSIECLSHSSDSSLPGIKLEYDH